MGKTHAGDASDLARSVRFAAEQKAIDRFLSVHLEAIAETLETEKKLALTNRTDELIGQIKYHANQVSTIRWLISVNLQRKDKNNGGSKSVSKRRKYGGHGTDNSLGSAENR